MCTQPEKNKNTKLSTLNNRYLADGRTPLACYLLCATHLTPMYSGADSTLRFGPVTAYVLLYRRGEGSPVSRNTETFIFE